MHPVLCNGESPPTEWRRTRPIGRRLCPGCRGTLCVTRSSSTSMSKALPDGTLPFRVHLIRIPGRKSSPTLRLLLVEATSGQAVYEGFGSWSKCMRWIVQLSIIGIPRDELAAVRKRLDRNRLVTMNDQVWASLVELESLGLHRADSQVVTRL
jgi:hypothetical protein